MTEFEVEVDIPDDIQERATNLRQDLETFVNSTADLIQWLTKKGFLSSNDVRLFGSLKELVTDATALETELSKSFETEVEIDPPEMDEP
jgi:hypothetical protein